MGNTLFKLRKLIKKAIPKRARKNSAIQALMSERRGLTRIYEWYPDSRIPFWKGRIDNAIRKIKDL